MKKVLIIGSKGMAGHMIYYFLKENSDFEIVDIARNSNFHIPSHQLDVVDFEALTNVLKDEKPQYVINCIGVLNQDAESNPEKAILLNSYFPHFLAKIGNEIGFKLIHISTDCVFNGKEGNYTETSPKDGIGFYAQTKALGEIESANHLTLRTSIIGPELNANGIGLFNWFMHQTGIAKGYINALWSGVTTLELAKSILKAIEQDITGLHHLVNGDKINKYELINLFKTIFDKKDIEIEAYDAYKIDKSLIRTNLDFNYQVPSYKEMIQEMKLWMESHFELYKNTYFN
jgi:dTDP-4-dehydrorhamnose reductase